MDKNSFKHIYGPVASWRLGCSLGVDLLSAREKYCSFDCIYCQIGKTKTLTTKRKVFIPGKKIITEIKSLPNVKIDYITFSGRGEPTLAKNLGQVIKAIKRLRQEPIAVLTNASLLHRKDVRRALCLADLVAVKLDVDSQKQLELINKPAKGIKFSTILKGIKNFRKEYKGKLALQIMLMDANKALAKNIARLAKDIQPDEIQICTPIRISLVKPLSRKVLSALKRHFRGMDVISFYDTNHPISTPGVDIGFSRR